MLELKRGDLVRNKKSGFVLQLVSQYDNKNSGGGKSAVMVGIINKEGRGEYCILWPVEDCEPLTDGTPVIIEDKPISVDERLPTEVDGDEWGEVLVLLSSGRGWEAHRVDGVNMPLCTHWKRTPSWKPVEPLLESCKGCKNGDRRMVVDEPSIQVCWKHRVFDSEPFYLDGKIPCHKGE